MQEQKGCIYYMHCIETGKGYVGQHNRAIPDKRVKDHFQDAKRLNHLLERAIAKYGKEAFTVFVLCIVPHSGLNNMEAYWAEQLETYMWDTPGGYNMVWCGEKSRLGIKATEETRKKLSESHKGQIQTEEQRRKNSDALRGHIVTEETRQKISLARKGKPLSEKQRLSLCGKRPHVKRIQTEETKRKISEGRKKYLETKRLQETN